ncbi:hypothetical protein QVD17_30921 [Tagetes erecta]|uniref:Uncharacterized protein n=1 Tax=Tagetes erecta TaxID=13708 RepID=A0AAD8K2F6_TARER|nr:hypothetical protein QVD17_30921 [Tagetes erecta]
MAPPKPNEAPATSSSNEHNKSLHPVYSVTNILTKVRVLDGEKVTYTAWVNLFQLHARGYKVMNHIDGTKPPEATDEEYESWMEVDAIVLQWIYGTLSDDLFARVLEPDSTALEAWLRVKEIFTNNKGSRSAALNFEFSNLTLNSMPSLEAYCQKLKELAAKLKDVDSPVTSQRLVLQLVSGLPSEYDTVATLINQQIPTWEVAVNMLDMERQRQAKRDSLSQSATHSAMTATTNQASSSSTNRRPNNTTRGASSSGNRTNNNRRNTQTGQNRSRNSQSQPWSNRGSQGQNQSNWQQQRRSQGNWQHQQQQAPWPNWWMAQQPTWFPPPCPYPTQPNWPSPWTNGP